MSYKTTNDLMQHLRDNGIAISGETQKQQLVTTGYLSLIHISEPTRH